MKFRVVLCVAVLFALGSTLPASAWVTEHCTVGFYKNHSQFLSSSSCTNYVWDANTLVSTLFPDVDPCVGAFTLEGLLQAPSSACGGGSTIAGGEIIMLRQAIARMGNAVNSTPISCDGVWGTIHKANATIDDAISTDNRNELIQLSQVYDSLNQGSCSLH